MIFNKICEIKGLTDQLFDYSLACNEEALELDAPCNMESAIGDYLSEMAFILRENSFSLDIEKLIWKDFKITVNSNFSEGFLTILQTIYANMQIRKLLSA